MQTSRLLVSLSAAVALALVHLFAGQLRSLEEIPRSRWLSFAGGISVSYVFLHLLPEVAASQQRLQEMMPPLLRALENHAFLVALVGLAVFYGLERMAVRSRKGRAASGGEHKTEREIFWIHILSFGLYNVLIGYLLLHGESQSIGSLLVFALAMALHFVVNDVDFREHHKEQYQHEGRWIVAGAVLTGWALGATTSLSEGLVSLMTAFLAGGIVLNVLKEELPRERESRFWAFALGLSAYAALLLSL